MAKSEIRNLKSHYLSRWAVMRHNQKYSNKIIALEDQYVLKNLTPGPVLFYNCLGDIYKDLVDQSVSKKYNNLVLINNIEFKYKTVNQINQLIEDLANEFLVSGGRIIASVSHKFLIYNRVEVSVNTLLSSWFNNSTHFKKAKFLNLLGKTNPGYGDYFFCVDYE